MPAGRPRKPTKTLELTGAFKKNPDRAIDRAEEPEPVGSIGAAPAHLLVREQKCWAEIVSIMPPGVAFDSDRIALEQFATLLAFCRKCKWQVTEKTLTRMEAMYARFGMTPADRTRIKVKTEEKKTETPAYGEFAKTPLKAVA